MPRCPVCDAARVIIVLSDRRVGMCPSCGARWIQDGDTQHHVRPAQPAAEAPAREPTTAS